MRRTYRRTVREVHKIAAVIGICCVFLACGFLIARLSAVTPTVVTRNEIDSGFLENSVREITELSTLSHRYTEISFFEDQAALLIFGRELNLPGTTRSFILTFSGDIRFGILGDDIQINVSENFDDDYSSIRVFLPPATVLTHAIDMDSVQLLDERTGIFTSFDLEDYTHFIARQQEHIEQRVNTSQFLEQAQEQAERAIYTLLRASLGTEGHRIVFVR